MAEFCLECFNEEFNKNFKEKEVTLEMDFCEGCAKYKPCVISIHPPKHTSLFFKAFLSIKRRRNRQNNR